MINLKEYSLTYRCPELLDRFKMYLSQVDPIEHKHRVKRAAIRLIRTGAVRVVISN